MITGSTEEASSSIARDFHDRSHPNLEMLDSLELSYPGFERDKREAEAVHFGTAKLNLGFDAAIRRLRVKQRAYEEQRSIRTIHRSHPNLVSLDALLLTYPGWKIDVEKAEKTHYNNPSCDFFVVLRRLQTKQLRHENDRSHYRLVAIDQLKLSYPGWKADIRSLEKFHFEEAFFVPGDSLFQSKLAGLKRRQQIYLRSQKIRGTRSTIFHPTEEAEEDKEEVPAIFTKGSYAKLMGSQTHEDDPQNVSPETENDSGSEEDRTDRQATRASYAVIAPADVDSASTKNDSRLDPEEPLMSPPSSRTPEDPPNRPDPPEREATLRARNTRSARERVDCEASTIVLSNVAGCNSIAPTNSNNNDLASSHNQTSHWTSKLSSYVDPEPIPDHETEVEDEADGANEARSDEETDDIGVLPTTVPSRSRYPTYKGRKVKPRGKYSAPPMIPSDGDEQQSTTSRAMSVATHSSSRAVFSGDASIATASQSSSQAVWTDERSVASATSSEAVWTEAPTPYVPETPSSIRAVQPTPDTPREGGTPEMPNRPPRAGSSRSRDDAQRGKLSREMDHSEISSRSERRVSSRSKKKASGEHGRKSRKSDEDRSRVSRGSRASSHGSSRSKKLGRCTICGDTDKNHVFVPCGHLCACKECAGQVIARKMACPVCRGTVTEAIQVFL